MSDRTRVDLSTTHAERGGVDIRGDDTGPELAGQLRHAFSAGELTAYYQPEYDVQSMDVVALEALCRWQHPVHGLLLPDQFIHIAERYGLIVDVGRFMLDESGQHVAAWRRRGLHIGLSINVSPTELDRGFARRVLRRLRELDLPYRAVTLEITESPAISYSRDELYALDALIAGGVGVSIDDFGTGNTSIELVRHLPLTEVKIDKSLVHDPDRAIDDLVSECLDIARDRGAISVAEGIETEEHFERAREWQCDRAQGYYFSPPLPSRQMEELLLAAH
jgi:EAL domain-containing protein (putative c-di-GMP-specific phosphodiesterase class I)